jgi:hypothetical protein
VGSGHFRSFSPASPIVSAADGRGAPPQPHNTQGLGAPQGREAQAHLSDHTGAWSGSSQQQQQHWRNKRPVSCSIGEMLNSARQQPNRGPDERSREPAPMTTPLTTTTARSGSPLSRKEGAAAAGSYGEHQPSLGASTTTIATASRSRAAMLTTVGSGSIGGAVLRRDKLHTGLVASSGGLSSSSSSHGGHRTLYDQAVTVAQERRNRDNEWRRSWSPSPPASAEPSSDSSVKNRPRRALLYRGHHHQQRHHQYQQQRQEEGEKEEDSTLPLPTSAIPVPDLQTPADVALFAGNGRSSSLPSSEHRTTNLSRASVSVSTANPPVYTPDASPRGRSITISTGLPSGGGDHRVYALLLDLQLTKYWRIFAEEEILLEDLNDMLEMVREESLLPPRPCVRVCVRAACRVRVCVESKLLGKFSSLMLVEGRAGPDH